jgi:outer membrane cobalamin receptor
VRKEKTTFSNTPAIFMVNGKLALDLTDMLTSNIKSIEIIPDGSAQYGPSASHGVVFITTYK